MLNAPNWQRQEPIDLAHEPDIQIGDAWLRPADRILEWNGASLILEPRVAQLLVALARQGGKVLGRDDLIDLCWGGRIVGDDAINRCVAKARRASAGAGFDIETVPRVGYRLVERSRHKSGQFRRHALVCAGLVALVATGAAIWLRASHTPATTRPAITVAQFTTSESDPAIAAKAAEIKGQIVHSLATVDFPVSEASARMTGEARYIVAGTVNQQPPLLIAKVQVSDVQTGKTIISQELEIDRDEVSLLPDKVAALAANALTQAGAYHALTEYSTGTGESAAFMSIMLKIANGEIIASLATARRFNDERPQSRLAPLALSLATVFALQQQIPAGDRLSILRRGQAATALAHRRLPKFGDTYVADCWLRPLTLSGCEQVYHQALALDPTSPLARSQLAYQLMHAGRLAEAQQFADAAVAQNPFDPVKVNHSLYLAELLKQRGHEAERWMYAQRYWPRLRFARQRFVGLLASGRWQEAEALVPLVLRLDPSAQDRYHALFAALHNPTPAKHTALIRECDGGAPSATPIVCVLALSILGDGQASLEIAERILPKPFSPWPTVRQSSVLNGRDQGGTFLLWGDGAKTLRREPAFSRLVQRNGLLDYWKSNGPPDFCRNEPAPVCKLI